MGVSTSRTSKREIASTGRSPRRGKAWRSSVAHQSAACLLLRHRGRFALWTSAAASWNVGAFPRRFSASGSPAFGHSGPVEGRQRAGLGQGYGGETTETEFAALAADGDALGPRLGAGVLYEQVQAAAVAVRSGFLQRLALG